MNARRAHQAIIAPKMARIRPAVCVHPDTTAHLALSPNNRNLAPKESTAHVEARNHSYVPLARINQINTRMILVTVSCALKVFNGFGNKN